MEEKKSLKDLLAIKKNVEGDEATGVKAMLGEREKELDGFIEKTKDKMDVSNWLKKAAKHELESDYRKAIESYLQFMEAKLIAINSNTSTTMLDYFALVKYYLKIAECYERVTHTSAGGKQKDMENAGKYYTIAAQMYLDQQKYDDAFKCYEKAASCFADVESYINAANAYMDAAAMQYSTDKKLMACTCVIKAADYYEKGEDCVNASKAYLKAGEINEDINDMYGAMNAYKKAGECYDKMGNPKDAIQYYIRSAELSGNVDRYSEVADRYTGIAKSYEKLNDYASAIFYHMRAAELNKGNNDLSSSYNLDSVAKCHEHMGNNQKAIEFYHRSMEMRITLKKYGEAAAAAYEIAKIHEQTGDFHNAAKMYFLNGEYSISANLKTASDGFGKSATMYEQMAEKDLLQNNIQKAEENLLEAAISFDKLNNKKQAADLYHKLGDMEYAKNYDNAVQHYSDAASRYYEVGENYLSANSYLLAKDYLSAAKNFTIYAMAQLKKAQFFYAANGFRNAGDTYSKLKKLSDTKDSYGKAVHNYQQYLERAQYIRSDDPDMNVGNANKKIGECYMELDETPTAKKFLEKAVDYFIEYKKPKDQKVTESLINITKIDLAFKVGEYDKGKTLLDQTLQSIDEIIKSNEWPADYVEFLQRNKDKVKVLIGRLDIKPEIDLIVEEPSQPYLTKATIIIKATIINKSKYPINNLYFITTLPQEMKVTKEPAPILEMKENETNNLVIEAIAQGPGKFCFAPLEMLYKDKSGNKYMKSSDEIIVEINEPPEAK